MVNRNALQKFSKKQGENMKIFTSIKQLLTKIHRKLMEPKKSLEHCFSIAIMRTVW